MSEYLIEARNVRKLFGGVVALDGADFFCSKGKIVGLLGENGSGKSTLSNIITGNYVATEGEIYFKGKKVHFLNPREAEKLGISMVFQNFSLIPDMTIWENLFLGIEPLGHLRMMDNKKMKKMARDYLNRLCPNLDLNKEVKKLSTSEQQLVEITKALTREPQFLILDEPTSALEREEVKNLFELLNELKNKGLSIVFISHRLHEVEEICDNVFVLRNGRTVGEVDLSDKEKVNYDEIVQLITGKKAEVAKRIFSRNRNIGKTILNIQSINDGEKVKNVSFEVRKGEIVGIAGLQGQGQEELMLALAGYKKLRSGKLNIDGKEIVLRHPRNAISVGIALVPGNRQTEGLFMGQSVFHNLTLPKNLLRGQRWFLNKKDLYSLSSGLIHDLSLKTSSLSNPISALSGGNAQKVVVAKWLPIKPNILLLSDPAKGIDVQSKDDLYKLVADISEQGASIIIFASDLNELLHICDRILIMYEGKIINEIENSEGLDEEILMGMCIQSNNAGCKGQKAEGEQL